MAVREIKTTLSLDGEKEFNRAINEAGRGMRVMASEMKAAAADFDVTGDEMEYLGRKSRSLNSQIEQQEKIIRALEGAVADSAQTYGEASAKTDGYRIKLNNAYAALSRLKKEHEQTDKRMEELGRDSERTGRKLEQGIGEAADDVSRKFDGMVNKLDSDIGSIKSMTSISAVVDVAGKIGGALKGAYDGVKGLVDETAEYNRDIGKLKTNAQNAGIEFALVKDLTKDIAVITGDMDASIEGMSNLLGAGLNADELVDVVNQLLGAVIKFPDTMKFETLAEDLRMAIGEGGISGSLSELLTTLLPNGIKDLELLNKAIVNASKVGEGPKKTAVLSSLTELGLEETYELYKAQNKEITKYYEAQYKLTDAMANLGKTMTPASTSGIEMMSGFVDKMTELISAAGKKVEEFNAEAEQSQEAAAAFDDAVDAETGYYTKLDELNEKIREADRSGNTLEASRLMEERKKLIDEIASYVQENDDKITESLTTGVTDGLEEDTSEEEVKSWWEKLFSQTMLDDTKSYGSDIAKNIGDGIDDNAYYAIGKARAMMSSIQSALNRKLTYPTISPSTTTSSTAYASAGTGKTTLSIDGKKLGEATVAYNNAALGQSLIRAETYG